MERQARPGLGTVVAAAEELLGGATLHDLLGFASTRKLAVAAGVSPASVSYHVGGRPDRLAAALLDSLLAPELAEASRRAAAGVDETARDLRAGDDGALHRLAKVAAENFLGYSAQEAQRPAQDTLIYLAAASAPNDSLAASAMRGHYAYLRTVYAPAYAELMKATQRRPAKGFDVLKITKVITALTDGLLLQHRSDADHEHVELFADTVVRLFEAITVSESTRILEEADPFERLAPLPEGSNLDPTKRNAIVAAAGKIYDEKQWKGVTMSSVADLSGVSRGTLIAHFGGRGGLAAAIWTRFLPKLQTAAQHDAHMPTSERIRRHMGRLVELSNVHGQLTGALLQAVFTYSLERGAPAYEDAADPRTIVPLPSVLVPLIEEGKADLAPRYVDSDESVRDLAAFLTNTALHRAMARPGELPSVTTDYVWEICSRGLLGGSAR